MSDTHQLTIDDAAEQFRDQIRQGLGRYRLQQELNDLHEDHAYSEKFARRVIETVWQDGYTTVALPEPIEESTPEEWRAVRRWERADGGVSTYKVRVNEADPATVAERAVELFDEMIRHRPPPRRQEPLLEPLAERTGNLAVLSLKDVHYGKLSIEQETGHTWSLDAATRVWRAAYENLLPKVSAYRPDAIILIVGSDALHVNGASNSTQKGTVQDVEGRWYDAFDQACRNYVEVIDVILEDYTKRVHLLFIPGNHAGELELLMARWLRAWYRSEPRVIIDDTSNSRKYLQWGQNLLGFTHGENVNQNDLPMIMAVDRPLDWGATRYREWHTDHRHHRSRKLHSPGDLVEHRGVVVRISPALCGPDRWHYDQGYVGALPGAEAFVYHEERGLEIIANATVSL